MHQHKHLHSYAVQSIEELNQVKTKSKRYILIFICNQSHFQHGSKHAYANAKDGAVTNQRENSYLQELERFGQLGNFGLTEPPDFAKNCLSKFYG